MQGAATNKEITQAANLPQKKVLLDSDLEIRSTNQLQPLAQGYEDSPTNYWGDFETATKIQERILHPQPQSFIRNNRIEEPPKGCNECRITASRVRDLESEVLRLSELVEGLKKDGNSIYY